AVFECAPSGRTAGQWLDQFYVRTLRFAGQKLHVNSLLVVANHFRDRLQAKEARVAWSTLFNAFDYDADMVEPQEILSAISILYDFRGTVGSHDEALAVTGKR